MNRFKRIQTPAILLAGGIVLAIIFKKNILSLFSHQYSSPSKFNPHDIAERQMQAMGHFGTDEKLLFESLNGLTSNELRKVFDSFGYKPYLAGTRIKQIGRDLNLFEWYERELNEKEKVKMRILWGKTGLELIF